MGQLILTVGLPRAGKTTWAMEQGVPVISPDAIRLAVHGRRFWSPGENLVWSHAWTMACSLFLAGHGAVIVDACHNTRKRRDFWRAPQGEAWADEDGPLWEIMFVQFPAGLETCLERAKGDVSLVPVIERMVREREPVSEEELRGEEVKRFFTPDSATRVLSGVGTPA